MAKAEGIASANSGVLQKEESPASISPSVRQRFRQASETRRFIAVTSPFERENLGEIRDMSLDYGFPTGAFPGHHAFQQGASHCILRQHRDQGSGRNSELGLNGFAFRFDLSTLGTPALPTRSSQSRMKNSPNRSFLSENQEPKYDQRPGLCSKKRQIGYVVTNSVRS